MTNTPVAAKPRPVRKMVRAGLLLNPAGVNKLLRSRDFNLARGTDVYVTAASQLRMTRLISAALDVMRENGVKRLTDKHVGMAIQLHPELGPGQGFVPNGVHAQARERQCWNDKKAVVVPNQSIQ